jgi:hypothetical protein
MIDRSAESEKTHSENEQPNEEARQSETNNDPDSHKLTNTMLASTLSNFLTLLFSACLVVAAFLTFLAIVAQVWIYNAQLKEMQKSTKSASRAAKAAEGSIALMRDNARLDQRAWVTVAGVTGFPEVGKPLVVTVHITNTGKSPAKNVKVTPIIESCAGDIVPDFPSTVAKIANSEIQGQGSVPSTVLLAPAAQTYASINLGKKNLAEGALTELRDMKYRIFVYGKIVYTDIFDCEHWTSFANFLGPTDNNGWAYLSYSSFNDAGDGKCPETAQK